MRFKLKLFVLIAGVFVMATPMAARANHLGAGTGHPAYPTIATEDIRNTLHNLGDSISGFDNPNITSAATAREVCAFCHTPHGANTGAPAAAPLWNRAVPASAGYTLYSSPNVDSTTVQPKGVSLACLSCHDGSIAVDALINMPGSGGYQTLTPPSADIVNPQAGSALLLASGLMSGVTRTDTGPNYGVITGGASPFPNLTTNLSDDHPISMPMPAVGTDPQFNVTLTADGAINKVTRNATTYADKRDAIRLYPVSGAGSPAGDWVECASCHNPHAPRPLFLRLPGVDGTVGIDSNDAIPAAWGGGAGVTWGQDPNRGSAVCLTCHEK